MHELRAPTMCGATAILMSLLLVPVIPVGQAARVQVQATNTRSGAYNGSGTVGRKQEAMGGGGGGGGGGSSGGSSWGYGWGWGWGWGTVGGGGGGGDEGGGGSGKGTRSEWRGNGSGPAAPRGRRARHRHRPSYSSSMYRMGEYARCTAPGRCRGMKLLCPMQCEGPCFYDCDANCKPHCRF